MARMVRQLLILARADAGATIEPRPTHLDQVLELACRQAERMANGVSLKLPTPHALTGATVNGDADHLTQVILILLDNAFKYTPAPGEVHLEASHDDSHARITIADTGLGIPPEDTERIFERFYRGRNTTATTGTGLGLAIAKWIVDQHNGRIELTTLANGTRFAVILPLTRTPK
ncbi:MAG TPA: hypothetical protein DGG94_14715 [Micromonosporaceae bacterium]|nr:hypothetical protein [Micromonosporaceae bacterium]